jgi:myo-inositol 2-dehydrogenase/D-chiro-inositol 1-dehydrogenase
VPGLQIGYEHTFVHQAADFLRGLANANVPGPSFRDALATDYVTDAILAAARNANWEKVNSAR